MDSDRPEGPPIAPVSVPTETIVRAGMACWVVALALTLLVPALRTGERDWWPWACVAGLALGALGWSYVRRGRGNASDA